jgi:hypothetical protein
MRKNNEINQQRMSQANRNLYHTTVWENHQEDVLEWDKKPTEKQSQKIYESPNKRVS